MESRETKNFRSTPVNNPLSPTSTVGFGECTSMSAGPLCDLPRIVKKGWNSARIGLDTFGLSATDRSFKDLTCCAQHKKLGLLQLPASHRNSLLSYNLAICNMLHIYPRAIPFNIAGRRRHGFVAAVAQQQGRGAQPARSFSWTHRLDSLRTCETSYYSHADQ